MTESYLDYARADAQVTWECFRALELRYDDHGLSKSADRMLSEASIGKAYLQQMGITPLLGSAPDFPRERFGEIFCAYYGGRAEVRLRREVAEILYCDFKSMYPTVNSLMGIWDFVIADGFTVEDSTAETQELLNSVTVKSLQQPLMWRKLCTLVRLRPDQDVFPVRAKYNDDTYTIGLNFLSSDEPLWFTLADCIVSKLQTGKSPRIDRAQTYRPGARQNDLKPVRVLGRSDYQIDPATDDFFRCLIDLRDEAKELNDSIEQTLKIIANSTSYGIFIEVNRDDAPKSEALSVYGPNGEHKEIDTRAIEDPGRYFHPLLGVLITGAARLMLGIAEKRVIDSGLDWAFCDTDSLAIVRPKTISRSRFHKLTQSIVNWFEPLNPYVKRGSILKIEDVNFAIGNRETIEPLFCFAISSKRYSLFNIQAGIPILRKASAHGLGHLLDPYPELDARPDVPPPSMQLKAIGVRRWQYDFWFKIIDAALHGKPNCVALDWHHGLSRPAALRYSASSPQLLNWVDIWNQGKAYAEQIRPFGFLLAFMPRTGTYAPHSAMPVDEPRRGNRLSSTFQLRLRPTTVIRRARRKKSSTALTGERLARRSLRPMPKC